MGYITVGTENSEPIELYYEDHGSGQPVILIHGYPLSSVAWEKQVKVLLDAGYRTITYDRRGFGKSSQPASGYDYNCLASDLSTIIHKLELKDVVLVGHSMGTGEITRYIGTFGSERISRAVLISPIPPYLLKTDDNPTGADQSIFEGIMDSIAKDRYDYLARFISDFFNYDKTKNNLVSQEAADANWNIAVTASPIATVECMKAWLTDFRDDLPAIDIPVLIIQGDADRILPLEATGRVLQEVLGDRSHLVIIEDGSHGISWTHATEINAEMLAFLGAPKAA